LCLTGSVRIAEAAASVIMRCLAHRHRGIGDLVRDQRLPRPVQSVAAQASFKIFQLPAAGSGTFSVLTSFARI
jgi:hypothetical protein